MTPDSPEIARLRSHLDKRERAFAEVLLTDLHYALARVDESCKGCALVETVKQQAEHLARLYVMIDDLMAQKRAANMCKCGGAEPSNITAGTGG